LEDNESNDYNSNKQHNRDRIKHNYNKKSPDVFLNDFSKPSLTLTYLNRYIEERIYKTNPIEIDKNAKYPYTLQVQKLLTNMLHVNSTKRYSASTCLDMPLFDKWRDLINETRKKYITVHRDITIYDRPTQITDKIKTWISVMKTMKNYCEDLYIIDYITIGNFIDCVDKICYAFHTKTFNKNNPYPFRISGMFQEDKKLISCEFDHVMSVLVYMMIKLHWHDSKMPYEEYFSILKKAYHKHHSKTSEKLVIDKIIPKYFSHIELSILHSCDGMLYSMNFIDLAKYVPNMSLKIYSNEYLKFSSSSNYTLSIIDISNNDSKNILKSIINSKLNEIGSFKSIFEQKEYQITFCPYLVNNEENCSITMNINVNNSNNNQSKVETKITHISTVESELKEKEKEKIKNTTSESNSNSNSNSKSSKTFEYYNKRHFTGITDERLARLFPSIQTTDTKKVNIEQVKSSRSSGSYTCKELREKLNSLGISYNTRQKKKELAELLRNNLTVKHESNRESIIITKK
jgi:hypothetical protein